MLALEATSRLARNQLCLSSSLRHNRQASTVPDLILQLLYLKPRLLVRLRTASPPVILASGDLREKRFTERLIKISLCFIRDKLERDNAVEARAMAATGAGETYLTDFRASQ